jgi:hypothetical protein
MIYQRIFDKKKFEDICIKKKEKIDQIALENCLPTIFNHSGQQTKYLKRFFGDGGIPVFSYRDEYQSRIKGHWDLFYYFITGSSVRYRDNGDIVIGKIKQCNTVTRKIEIETDEGICERDCSEVTRLFPSNFYESLFQ